MQDLNRINDFVATSNWMILIVSGLISQMVAPADVTLGVILGGLIAAINFHLLKKTLKTMFAPDTVLEKGRSVVGNVLMKYYFRFVVSGGLIFLLISKHIVHPIGLVLGLSVVVASVFLATMLELKRLFFKEAV